MSLWRYGDGWNGTLKFEKRKATKTKRNQNQQTAPVPNKNNVIPHASIAKKFVKESVMCINMYELWALRSEQIGLQKRIFLLFCKSSSVMLIRLNFRTLNRKISRLLASFGPFFVSFSLRWCCCCSIHLMLECDVVGRWSLVQHFILDMYEAIVKRIRNF